MFISLPMRQRFRFFIWVGGSNKYGYIVNIIMDYGTVTELTVILQQNKYKFYCSLLVFYYKYNKYSTTVRNI